MFVSASCVCVFVWLCACVGCGVWGVWVCGCVRVWGVGCVGVCMCVIIKTFNFIFHFAKICISVMNKILET